MMGLLITPKTARAVGLVPNQSMFAAVAEDAVVLRQTDPVGVAPRFIARSTLPELLAPGLVKANAVAESFPADMVTVVVGDSCVLHALRFLR